MVDMLDISGNLGRVQHLTRNVGIIYLDIPKGGQHALSQAPTER